jgi:hypothetical protein
VAFIFPFNSKYLGENSIMKRMISSLTGVEKIILIDKRQHSSKKALKYIMDSNSFVSSGDNNLITPAEEADIVKKIEQRLENLKATASQEHPE